MKIIKVCSFLYFILLPFIFWPGLPDPYELPKIIFFLSLTNILIGLYIFWILPHQKPNVKLSIVHLLLITLFIVYIISSLINHSLTVSLTGQYYRYQGLLTLFTYFEFFLLFSWLLENPRNRVLMVKYITAGHFLVCFTLLLQFFLLKIFALPIYTYNGRLTGFFGNPNFAAAYLTLSLPFAINYLSQKSIPLLSYCLLIIASLAALLTTGSRSALLALLVIDALLLKEKLRLKKNFFSILTFCLLLFALLAVFSRPSSPIENRPLIWSKALLAISQKPLFGWGLENFSTAFQNTLTSKDFDLKKIRVDKAHNEELEVAAAGGILALIVYVALLVIVFNKLWRNRQDPRIKTTLYSFIAFLIISQLNVLNLTSYLFFYLLLASITFLSLPNYDKKINTKSRSMDEK